MTSAMFLAPTRPVARSKLGKCYLARKEANRNQREDRQYHYGPRYAAETHSIPDHSFLSIRTLVAQLSSALERCASLAKVPLRGPGPT